MNSRIPLSSAVAFNAASNCGFRILMEDGQSFGFAQDSCEWRGLTETVGFGRFARNKIGQLKGGKHIEDFLPFSMNTMHTAVVLLHPPTEVRLGNLNQVWRGANLLRDEPVHRQADSVDYLVRVRELHRASLVE